MKISILRKHLMLCAVTATLCGALSACGGNDNEPVIPTPPTPEQPERPDEPPYVSEGFAKGADVSWLTELEDKGNMFYNTKGEATECMQLLRDECGVNAIRLRVWVNPANQYNSINDVLVKARRAHALGMRLMIDFHLSDNWADPGKQVVPAAWNGMSASQMAQAVKTHVTEMLTALKAEDITPTWVQIGNETTPGMLHPMGAMKDQNPGEFPRFLNAGYDAVKAVFPKAQVIVHLDQGNKKDTYTWFFDLLKKHNGKFDMIGMSLYPIIEKGLGASWSVTTDHQAINDCIDNIKYLASRYGKNVMICEIGFHHTQAKDCGDALDKIMRAYAGNDALQGIFYWEPEAEPSNTGYHKGCFTNGRPTAALDPFTRAVITPVQ